MPLDTLAKVLKEDQFEGTGDIDSGPLLRGGFIVSPNIALWDGQVRCVILVAIKKV